MSDLQEVCRQLRMTRDADERHHREIVTALARIERQLTPTTPLDLTAVVGGAGASVTVPAAGAVNAFRLMTTEEVLSQTAERLAAVTEERDARVADLLASQARVRELEEERDRGKRNYADLEDAVLARGYTITWTLESDPAQPCVRLEPTFALSPELATQAADKRASAAERKLALLTGALNRLGFAANFYTDAEGGQRVSFWSSWR